MNRHLAAALIALAFLLPAAQASAQDQTDQGDSQSNAISKLPWQLGPSKGQIGERATIDVPKGFAFLGADGTRKLDEIYQNPPSDVDQYVIAPTDLSWVAYFSFNSIGFVKDDEKLDADELLASVREGTEQSNKERRKRGWDTLQITGWSFKPQYDKQLNTLEWAINAKTEKANSPVVNYNTRLLGRRGVMEVTLVAAPDQLQAAIHSFKGLMPGYSFAAGEKYAEFKAGDHVAEIGLAALVTGGAAAVAAKKGLFTVVGLALLKAWKLLILAFGGAGMWIKKRLGIGGNQTVK